MSDLEPRVTMLERLHTDNSLLLKEAKTDFHHMTKTLDKIEVTLSRFAEVFSKVDNLESSISRDRVRIDAIENKTNIIATDFSVHKATKLDRKDIKILEEKLSAIELATAASAWKGKMFDTAFYAGLAAIGSGIAVYFFF